MQVLSQRIRERYQVLLEADVLITIYELDLVCPSKLTRKAGEMRCRSHLSCDHTSGIWLPFSQSARMGLLANARRPGFARCLERRHG